MKCFRLTEKKYCNPIDLLSGHGAVKEGGRWNQIAQPVVYAGDSPDVAIVEKAYYAYTQRLASAKAQFAANRGASKDFIKEAEKISLALATLNLTDSVKILDFTDENIWTELTRKMGIEDRTVEDSRKSPYDRLPGKWTQKLSHYVANNTDAVGFKTLSARHIDGKVIVLFSEKISHNQVEHELTEEIVLAPSGIGTISELKKRNLYELEVKFRGAIQMLNICEFPFEA